MDMSVKLNLSYPAVTPASNTADKLVAAPQVSTAVPEVAAATDTSTSKDSTSEQSSEKLKSAVQDIEKFVQSVKRNLEFSIDEESGKVIVKVIASDTGEVVRQLPSAEALKIADNLQNAHSLLFDAKV